MTMDMGLRFGVADGGGDRTASTAAVRPESGGRGEGRSGEQRRGRGEDCVLVSETTKLSILHEIPNIPLPHQQWYKGVYIKRKMIRVPLFSYTLLVHPMTWH
jgi:hypothetical protein